MNTFNTYIIRKYSQFVSWFRIYHFLVWLERANC